eukprot:gene15241-16815_t
MATPTQNETGVDMESLKNQLNVYNQPKNTAPKDVRDHVAKKFFCLRPGNIEHAIEDIKQYIDEAVDGAFISSWLMTEIDHWDHEKERLCIVTEKQLMVIKYNFVSLRIDECRRVNLKEIDKIQAGRFTYPKYTMMIPREFQNGIRLHIDKNHVLTTWESWNPLNTQTPFFTFTQHKAVPLLDDVPNCMMYEGFKKSLIAALEKSGAEFEAALEEISLNVYVGMMSVVHNSNDFGYSKDRGPVSF